MSSILPFMSSLFSLPFPLEEEGEGGGAVSRIDEKSSIPGIQGKENLKAGNSKISTQ
jgi:hypothetical protein